MAIWLDKFRAEFALEKESWETEEDAEEEDALTKMVDFFISKVDPMMKGTLTSEEIEQLDEETRTDVADIPEPAKNSKGEIDFFCYLKTIKQQDDIPPKVLEYMERSPLWTRLPIDYYIAAS